MFGIKRQLLTSPFHQIVSKWIFVPKIRIWLDQGTRFFLSDFIGNGYSNVGPSLYKTWRIIRWGKIKDPVGIFVGGLTWVKHQKNLSVWAFIKVLRRTPLMHNNIFWYTFRNWRTILDNPFSSNLAQNGYLGQKCESN